MLFSIAPELNWYSTERTRQLFERIEDELAATAGRDERRRGRRAGARGRQLEQQRRVEGFEAGPDTNTNASLNDGRPGIPEDDGHSARRRPRVHPRRHHHRAQGGHRQPGVREEVQPRRQPARQAHRRSGGANAKPDIEIVGVAQDARYSEVKRVVPPQYLPCRIGRSSASATPTSTSAPRSRPSRCSRPFPRSCASSTPACRSRT